jgi:hypothetical protein
MYRLEPDETILKEILEGNLIVLTSYLYLHNRPIHDRLVEIANNIDTNLLLGYREINLSDDDEFENWLSDLTPEQQEEVRNLRLKIQNEESKLPEGFIEYDELAQEQYIEWQLPLAIYDILTFRIHYRRDPTLAQMALTIAVMIQIWSVFLHRDLAGLTLVDDQVDIVLEWQKQDDTEPIYITSEVERDKLIVTLAITSQYIKQVADIDPDGFLAFFLKTVPHIIRELSIDPPDEIMHLFDPEKYGAGVNSMIIAGSPAFLWESAFARTVMGVDDAS